MTREIIAVDGAPKAVGAYSQAVLVSGGRTLYTAGQIALDPATGYLVGPADVKAQTIQVLSNLTAVLAGAAMDFTHVVKTSIFLADMADFSVVNEEYRSALEQAGVVDFPARSTVAVRSLPKAVLVEIDMVAVG